jgi:hypothetical protein
VPGRSLSLSLVGIALGFVLFTLLARDAADFDPENAALGLNTRMHSARLEGEPVSARRLPDPAFCDAIRHLRAQGHPIALWLGGSQLHGVNAMQPGDELAVSHANSRAAGRSAALRFAQVSFANGNFNEFLASYLTLRDECGVPDWLIVSLTYDDLREPGIRATIVAALPEVPDELVARFGDGLWNLQTARSEAGRRAPVQRTVTSDTPQEHLETFLTRSLEAIWPDYASRSKVQAQAGLHVQIALASVAGGLLQRRAAPIPPDLQRWNQAGLDSLLALAAADGVEVLLYQAPHRPDPGPFYHDRDAYDAWHAELRARAKASGFALIDLETLVPAEHWGLTNEGRPDAFHFTGEGHRRLGEAIDRFFEERDSRALQ